MCLAALAGGHLQILAVDFYFYYHVKIWQWWGLLTNGLLYNLLRPNQSISAKLRNTYIRCLFPLLALLRDLWGLGFNLIWLLNLTLLIVVDTRADVISSLLFCWLPCNLGYSVLMVKELLWIQIFDSRMLGLDVLLTLWQGNTCFCYKKIFCSQKILCKRFFVNNYRKYYYWSK